MKGCLPTGTMVVQVAATDADDPTYGNSARVIYSIVHGQPYFSVEPKTGMCQTKWSYGTQMWPVRKKRWILFTIENTSASI